ncbi:MAG: hypothetical protein BV458_11310 [Thermoplasmata archaeon M9B2D]|nr:MAG: hypothetical protein BV458_11310 [Thermoplasmata archaeon M9B2D]
MSMFSFKVGKEEIHTIYFSWNRWLGRFEACVDEKPVLIRNQLIIGAREVAFEVGEKERHKIKMSWKMPSFGFLRTLNITVFIDDAFYNTYQL